MKEETWKHVWERIRRSQGWRAGHDSTKALDFKNLLDDCSKEDLERGIRLVKNHTEFLSPAMFRQMCKPKTAHLENFPTRPDVPFEERLKSRNKHLPELKKLLGMKDATCTE